MSTQEKKVIALHDSVLLQEVGIEPQLIKYRELYIEEKGYEADAAKVKKLRDAIGESLIDLIGAAEVDTLTHEIDNEFTRFTVVNGNPNAVKLDRKKLANALIKVGRLSKETANAVIKAGSTPAPRNGYLRYSVGKDDDASDD